MWAGRSSCSGSSGCLPGAASPARAPGLSELAKGLGSASCGGANGAVVNGTGGSRTRQGSPSVTQAECSPCQP